MTSPVTSPMESALKFEIMELKTKKKSFTDINNLIINLKKLPDNVTITSIEELPETVGLALKRFRIEYKPVGVNIPHS